MNIVSLSENARPKGSFVVALGMFDGLHLGHQQLIKTAIGMADKLSARCAVFTFKDPKTLFICTADTRLELFEKAGVDTVFVADFDKMRDLTPVEFSDVLKNGMNAVGAVCGFNFRFGKNASGESSDLRRLCTERGIEVSVVPCYKIDDNTVSSSLVRDMISNGDVESAAKYLGREFYIDSKTVHGRRIGHVIGFPTMNIELPQGMVRPANGVYFTSVVIDGESYPAITNVGIRPTFGVGRVNVESHIITEFDKETYGEDIRVIFHKHSRDEIKFKSIDLLKNTLENDKKVAKEYFGLLQKENQI